MRLVGFADHQTSIGHEPKETTAVTKSIWINECLYFKFDSLLVGISLKRLLSGFSAFFSAIFHIIRGRGTPDAWHFIKRLLPDLTWVSSGIDFHLGGTAIDKSN